MDGNLLVHNDRLVHGPYMQYYREELLKKLLKIQKTIQSKKSLNIPNFELISMDELQEIQRIWVTEKNEIEDNLPRIYKSVFGRAYPQESNTYWFFGKEEMEILSEICGDDRLQFEMIRDLLSIEKKFSFKVKRAGLYEDLEKAVKKSFYENEIDAEKLAIKLQEAKANAKKGAFESFSFIETLDESTDTGTVNADFVE